MAKTTVEEMSTARKRGPGVKKADKSVRRAGAAFATTPAVLLEKLLMLRPLLEDDELCYRFTTERTGPGEWLVKKKR